MTERPELPTGGDDDPERTSPESTDGEASLTQTPDPDPGPTPPTAGFEPAEGAVDMDAGPAGAEPEASAGAIEPTAGFDPAEGAAPADDGRSSDPGDEPAAAGPDGGVVEPMTPTAGFAPAEGAPEAAEVESTTPTTPGAEPTTRPTKEDVPDVPEAEPVPDALRTVGRAIADALRAAGVRLAFTVPGESFLGILDALDAAGIRVIATRHEGGAAFMAEAHGQLTGRPAVALATRAVGAANLAIGIHTAHQDSAPMFVLVGQVERAHRGHEAFQETDLATTIGGLAVYADEPDSVEAVGPSVGAAIHHALDGRPGPVLLSLPEDLLDQPWPSEARIEPLRRGPARASDDDIRATIELLASARRPVILAGGGVLRARTSTDLLAFAELLSVPIIAGWRRGDVISNDHPLFLGMAGMGAPSVVRDRLAAADAILVIGCRINEPTGYEDSLPAPDQRWIHVDIDPGRAPGLSSAERTVTADARAFLRTANERLRTRSVLDAERVRVRQAANAEDRAAWEAATIVDAAPWDGPGIHPGRVVATLRRILPDDAILTTDAGNFASWIGRGFRFRKPGTFIGPTSGAMGYGLPAAITAALVHRDRPVVAVTGDGGFAMTMAELETAVREHARVIALVFDNQRYGTIRMWQERRGTGQGVATELGPIDFAAIARAVGARGVTVDTDAAFEPALRQALAEDRSTVIHLRLDPAWVSVDSPPGSAG
jgi:acetolactate synthase-1/2/3 large subunit